MQTTPDSPRLHTATIMNPEMWNLVWLLSHGGTFGWVFSPFQWAAGLTSACSISIRPAGFAPTAHRQGQNTRSHHRVSTPAELLQMQNHPVSTLMLKGTFLVGPKSQEDGAGTAGSGWAGDAFTSFCDCSRNRSKRLIASPHALLPRGFGKKEKKKKI